MSIRDKARMLVDKNLILSIERKLAKSNELAKSKNQPPDTQLFIDIHFRIYKILKTNFLDEFYQ